MAHRVQNLKRGAIMKAIKVSDEVYERLREFVVDPFDDTPQSVIARLVEIADKAKKRWSAFDITQNDDTHPKSMAERARMTNQNPDEAEVIL